MQMIEIISKVNKISIMWFPTNNCNYNCSYCFDEDRLTKYNILPWSETKLFFDDLFSHYMKLGIRYYKIGISGGEPTIYKNILEACEYFRKKEKDEGLDIHIHSSTNLSKPKEWLLDYSSYLDSFSPSFHVDHADKDDFLEKIIFLERKVFLLISMMLHKERFWEVVDFGNRLMDRDGSYTLIYSPILEEGEMCDYSLEELEFIKKNYRIKNEKGGPLPRRVPVGQKREMVVYDNGIIGEFCQSKIAAENNNTFKGWECDIGLKSLQISYNGLLEASGCNVRCLGNWATGEYTFPTDSIICPRDICTCGFDIPIPKRRV